ncbi:siderophore iron transporter-like protein mirB [Plenodomus tracheiphilus IPT5]|uniref:Siderophore iron transporter-like protein mirB n=1 Tax=Plenodomus tracheiphilus IPT5 TaxID=1408161 RepID=A0A6A7AS42_9PLEO|nr:siderophore iron transporter-like protein mirB [Plenodomus tracheiphilus IPT5]
MIFQANASPQKEARVVDDAERSVHSNSEQGADDLIADPTAQPGVQNIEAVTVAWTTAALTFAYIMIWLTYFVEGMLAGTTGALSPYVTSAFALHSLTPTVGILSSVIGGVTNLTLAKILDVFGRPQGYICCVILATIGLIMMAACNNVEAYAAAQVFYTVGNNGIQYSLSVFIADTSSLRNRGLVQAFASSANLITCWLGGPIAQGFLAGPGWRWAFAMFTIMVPAVTLPLWGLLMLNFRKAKKQGLVPKHNSQRSSWEMFVYYCREFDAIGLFLISAGVALFLLPFNLYTMQAKGWDSPLIICMLVFGILLITGFIIWERFFAPITMLPYALLMDRTVFGACLLSATAFISFWLWNSFFSSFLQVVKGLSVENASYVVQCYTVASVLSAIFVGWLIHHTGRFKPVCLYFGVPMSVFGLGLMIHFRNANGNIGYIVMCQIFIAFASGTIIICDEIAMLAAAAHQHIAIAIAVLSMFGSVGGAIGLTIASAIWQNIFPKKLLEYLPAEELPNFGMIYADLNTQLTYPMGSPTRVAIQRAYADAQVNLLSAGVAVWAIGFVAVLMWRNINVIGIQQTKGHVW